MLVYLVPPIKPCSNLARSRRSGISLASERASALRLRTPTMRSKLATGQNSGLGKPCSSPANPLRTLSDFLPASERGKRSGMLEPTMRSKLTYAPEIWPADPSRFAGSRHVALTDRSSGMQPESSWTRRFSATEFEPPGSSSNRGENVKCD